MNICGVICELNPFHNGHEYLFREAKRITDSDRLIAVMSGDFVQRGIPAVCDKYTRCRMALLGGADLVLELPTIYSTASADYFAFGAVSLLNNLGCVDFLCFGSETGDILKLKKTAKNYFSDVTGPHILSQGTGADSFSGRNAGESFAKAFSRQVGDKISSNDMLALCYIRSLKLLASDIEAVAVKRVGADYLDVSEDSGSATAIRRKIYEGKDYGGHIPDYALKALKRAEFDSFPINIDDFSIQLNTRMNTILRNEDRLKEYLTDYMDVSQNIAGRIRNNIYDFTTYDDFITSVHSKEYTKSRVMRALTHILLNVRKSDYPENIDQCQVGYARILGFRRESSDLLSEIKEKSLVPVISKAKDAQSFLDDDVKPVFDIDTYAANVYEQACAFKFKNKPVHDFSKEIVIV